MYPLISFGRQLVLGHELVIVLQGFVLVKANVTGIRPHKALIENAARERLVIVGFDGFEPDVIRSGDGAAISASFDRLIDIRHHDEKTHSGVWRDLAVRKRKTEVDAHFVPIVQEAQRRGLAVPRLRRLITLIHEIESGQRDFDSRNLDELAGAGPKVPA